MSLDSFICRSRIAGRVPNTCSISQLFILIVQKEVMAFTFFVSLNTADKIGQGQG